MLSSKPCSEICLYNPINQELQDASELIAEELAAREQVLLDNDAKTQDAVVSALQKEADHGQEDDDETLQGGEDVEGSGGGRQHTDGNTVKVEIQL